MNEPRIVVLDSESDGLAYECTKLHILSYTYDGNEVNHLKDYEDMREFLTQENTLYVAHNGVMHDMVVFNRILGVPMDYRKWIDTLAISWFLWPDRQKHGLESFSEEAGVEKPKVEDWENVTWDQMKERCGNDVLINWWVWKEQEKRLGELYE